MLYTIIITIIMIIVVVVLLLLLVIIMIMTIMLLLLLIIMIMMIMIMIIIMMIIYIYIYNRGLCTSRGLGSAQRRNEQVPFRRSKATFRGFQSTPNLPTKIIPTKIP